MIGAIRIDTDSLKAALAPSADCATLEELGRLAEAGPATRDPQVAEHVAGCLRCRTELALLAEFEAAAPRPDEQLAARWITARLDSELARLTRGAPEPLRAAPDERPALRRPRRLGAQAVAGVLALAAALVLFVNLRGRDVSAPVLSPDAGTAPTVFRSNAVTLVAPADDLAEPPTELRWEAVSGATSYSVTITEVDRTEIWRAEVRTPSAPLPVRIRARAVPGKPLLWQVVAKDATGGVVATSGVQRFRVSLPQPGARP